jgi:CRISPR/Cas system CSM-associated protein Csm3 (group 7 of RAMP superfamily)
MSKKYTLNAQFQTFWHIGTGRGSGQSLDALVEKDAHGIPYIPGKTLKGLFRDAFYKLDQWQNLNNTNLLFGSRNTEESNDESHKEQITSNETTSGILRFSNLELKEKDYLKNQKQKQKQKNDLIPHLFQVQANTKIDSKTGSAEKGSLRMTEVVIPVQLSGSIQIISPLNNEQSKKQVAWLEANDVQKLLEQAASLITHIGANKNRGLGRVVLEIKS